MKTTNAPSALTPIQQAALGHLAHRPWGSAPRRPVTWKSLRERGLVKQTKGRPGERGLLLTDGGKDLVAQLEWLKAGAR